MKYDIIIPSRPNLDNLTRLLNSISIQSILPTNIYILIDKFCNNEDLVYYRNILTPKGSEQAYDNLNIQIITNYNSDFKPQQGVSYVRNYGIKLAESEYIMLLDDDTELPQGFIKQIIDKYIYIQGSYNKPFIIFPTIKYHNTDIIQTQGYNMMHYWMMRPEPVLPSNDFKSKIRKSLFGRIDKLHKPFQSLSASFSPISMCPSICLFGNRKTFIDNLYDERMKFVYEDLDMTMRMGNKGIYIYNTPDIYIHHRESPRNKLQSSFLTPQMAYNKSRNRILLVYNNATRGEKLLFFTIGLPGQTLRFIIFVTLFGTKKLYTIGQIFKGIYDGIRGR